MKLLFVAGLLFAACTVAQAETRSPAEAIRLADRNPAAAFGTYSFAVRAIGSDHDLFFLDSEDNYRDAGNLAVEIGPAAAAELRKLYGNDLGAAFLGKTIWVRGEARRVPIVYVGTDRGYFQHRVRITRASQLSFAPPD
jgi:hypothetical protein